MSDEIIRRVGELPLPEPTTVAELEALPEAPSDYRQVTCQCGTTLNIPFARPGKCRVKGKDSIMFWRDKNGDAWEPVMGDDGIWYKQRNYMW